MKLSALVKRPKRIFYGWWVILAGTIIGAIGGGIYVYGFTTFFLPLQKELGLSRTAYSAVVSVARLEGAIEGPIAGWLIDRFGARKLMVIGLLMFGAGFILMYWMDSLLYFILVFVGLIAIGHNTGFLLGAFALANKWFIRQRSKATGFVSTAFGIGGAVVVPILGWLIIQYGWRLAALVAGVATLVIGLPALLMIRSTPEGKGLLPDGAEAETKEEEKAEKPSEAAGEISFSVKEALKSRAFWILSLGFNMRMFVIGSIWVHMVPLFVWKGFDEQQAANAIGIILVCTIPSRIGFGWLGDRYPKNRLLMLCCTIETVALIIALTTQSLWLVYLFAIVWALGYGVAPLNVSIIGEYFGRKNFATIRGTQTLSYALGTLTGPIYAGYIYDVTQSYETAFITCIAVYFLAGLVFLLFARPPKPPTTVTSHITS